MKKLFTLFLLLFISTQLSAQIGGNALDFDGVDDYVEVADPTGTSMDFTSLTIEVWVFWEGTVPAKVIGKTLSTSHETSFVLGITATNKLQPEVWQSANGINITSTESIPTNQWVHLAMTWTSGGALIGYINGVEVVRASNVNVTNINTNQPLRIGTAPWFPENYFNGKMDEIRIWNKVRTTEEIRSTMYKELSGSESGLVAYYKFEEGTGSTVEDLSANTNNGTLHNSPTWKASGCFAGSRNCLDFDGSDDCVVMPQSFNNGFDNLTNFSFCGWVYCTDLETSTLWGTFFTTYTSNPDISRITFHQLPDGYGSGKNDIFISIDNGSTYGEAYTQSAVLKTGVWQHFAVIYDGTKETNVEKIKIYVDGILQSLNFKNTNFPTSLPNDTEIGYLGRYANGDYFKGGMFDEFSFWSKSLSEDEIHEIMFRNLTGKEDNLFAYYRFDESDGATVYDITSNGNNGTLTTGDALNHRVASTAFNTWIGGDSQDWATASNWSNGVPSSTDNIGIYKWNLGNDVSHATAFSAYNLFISSTSSPTLPSNITVNGNFIIQKDIDISGKTITLGSNGYLVEGSNRLFGDGTIQIQRDLGIITDENIGGLGAVISCSKKTIYVIGAGSQEVNLDYTSNGTDYEKNRYTGGPCEIKYNGSYWEIWGVNSETMESYSAYSNHNAGIDNDPPLTGWVVTGGSNPAPTLSIEISMGTTTVLRGHAEQSDGSNNSIKRYYTITPTNNINLDATLVFNYREEELNGLTESSLGLFKETGSNIWLQFDGTLNTTNNTFTQNNISSFSKWTLAKNSAFPVTLQTFNASSTKDGILLTWQTATEINNYGFEIQRAVANCNFETIGFVAGNGNSNSTKSYSYTDTYLSNEKLTYRLKQIDNDGKFVYSDIIEVNGLEIPTNFALYQNYPNPFNPSTTIKFDLPEKQFVSLKVYDILGKEITTLVNETLNAGTYQKEWNPSSLSSGVYIYRIQTDKFTQVCKMNFMK